MSAPASDPSQQEQGSSVTPYHIAGAELKALSLRPSQESIQYGTLLKGFCLERVTAAVHLCNVGWIVRLPVQNVVCGVLCG